MVLEKKYRRIKDIISKLNQFYIPGCSCIAFFQKHALYVWLPLSAIEQC